MSISFNRKCFYSCTYTKPSVCVPPTCILLLYYMHETISVVPCTLWFTYLCHAPSKVTYSVFICYRQLFTTQYIVIKHIYILIFSSYLLITCCLAYSYSYAHPIGLHYLCVSNNTHPLTTVLLCGIVYISFMTIPQADVDTGL